MKSSQQASQLLALAETAFKLNNFLSAKNLLTEFLKIDSNNSRANELLAYIHGNSNNPNQALKLLEIACLDPNCSATALYELGSLYIQFNEPKLAITPLENALLKAGPFFEGLHDLGVAYASTGNLAEASKNLEKAATLNHSSAELFYNIALIYDDMSIPERALEFYKKAINIDPSFIKACVNQGIILHSLKRYKESLASYDAALSMDPNFADAWLNRGFCLHSLMMLNEAIDSYKKAIAIDPNLAEAHFNLGLTLLLQGKLESGFHEYEWRWQCKEFSHQNRFFSEPRWTGNFDLNGKTILLHNEQGLGDAIQFVRYIKILASMGAKVILETEKPLFSIFTNLDGIAWLIEKGSKLPRFDCHSPLMSLPLALKTQMESIPSYKSYLTADPLKKLHWEKRLGPRKRPRIGVVWSSFSNHKRDKDRTILLSSFINAFPENQFELICLQQKIKSDDVGYFKSRSDIHFFGDDLKDLSDTASLIACVDLVISVDTSVAHLAGALGKSTWTLISYCPDWRWLANISTTPWYPTMKLYRQDSDEAWDRVMQTIRTELSSISL